MGTPLSMRDERLPHKGSENRGDESRQDSIIRRPRLPLASENLRQQHRLADIAGYGELAADKCLAAVEFVRAKPQ